MVLVPLLAVTPCAGPRALGIALAAPVTSPAASSVPAATTPLLARLSVQKNGVFTLQDVRFSLLHKSTEWAPSYQRDVVPAAGSALVGPLGVAVQGTWKTASGTYQLLQELKPHGAGVQYHARVTGTPTSATRILCLSLGLPVEDYRSQKLYLDDTAMAIPWWYEKQALVQGQQKVKRVRVPLKDGSTLEIKALEGRELRAYVEDNRQYGSAEISLQIALEPDTGSITTANLEVRLEQHMTGSPAAVAYLSGAKPPPRKVRAPQQPQTFVPDAARIAASLARVRPLPQLLPRGEMFVGPDGKSVRFWGMNAVAFYPEYALAEKTAANMAGLGINMVRLHHNMRPSTDWAARDAHALVTYEADSRTPNLKAWDHYDFFNAQLRERGIYLSVSLHSSRTYYPEDGAILDVSAEDNEAWANAMDELNHWQWRKAIDPRKMLPVIDERCFLLNAEFALHFLGHVNPYTGLAYGRDPQVATVELINEFSTEYTLTTGNVFPEYWTTRLNARLAQFARERGAEPFTVSARKTPAQLRLFSEFCNGLDEAYTRRMEKLVREAGYTGPIAFSNLWRGDANLRLRSGTDGFIEDHAYLDPLVVQDPNQFLLTATRSAVANKPVIIGEFNQAEDGRIIQEREPVLSMLPAALTAYASLQNQAGIIWFAWSHGALGLDKDGWAIKPSNGAQGIGTIAGSAVLLDHMRSSGLIFKKGYLSSSSRPQTIVVDNAYVPNGYNDLMRGQFALQSGWQGVHAFRKVFGAAPPDQAKAPWFQGPPAHPTISDTGQIVRDSQRRQLSFAAPCTEGFSGYLDGRAPAQLNHLRVAGSKGFATVLAVTLDEKPLASASHILLSRTCTGGAEADGAVLSLAGLKRGQWQIAVTRPAPSGTAAAAPEVLKNDASGSLVLPAQGWTECELRLQ